MQKQYCSLIMTAALAAFSGNIYTKEMPSTAEATAENAAPKLARKKGSLKVITGPMFAGKTTELMRFLECAQRAKKAVFTIKHEGDNRVDVHCINTHNGKVRTASPANNAASIRAQLPNNFQEIDFVGIDEIHFFDPDIATVINDLVDAGVTVIAVGLDINCFREPFKTTQELMAHADKVIKLSAVCTKCGEKARFHELNLNFDNLPVGNEVRLTGERTSEAHCRDCKKWPLSTTTA